MEKMLNAYFLPFDHVVLALGRHRSPHMSPKSLDINHL